ncbi:DNA-directed RNA polymerase II subunit RPB11a, partial [Piedraia hortae CBS 480.64]
NDPPPTCEQFLRKSGAPMCTFVVDQSAPNTCIFTFEKEDHTLLNLMTCQLQKSPNVLFAAYNISHPLFPVGRMRVQTNGTVSPRMALIIAARETLAELAKLLNVFSEEVALYKAMHKDR